jgi:signal transduction histidine kinase
MPRLLLFFLTASLFCCTLLHAQSFTFADTYPTNNVDSLENWLKTHPKPTVERLKNLIRLEKTYIWGYSDLIGSKLHEIRLLNAKLKMPIGSACELYIRGITKKSNNELGDASIYFINALRNFTTLQDTAAMIHVYCILVQNATQNYAQGTKSKSQLPEEYLKNAQKLATSYKDIHTQILLKHTILIHNYARAFQGGQDQKREFGRLVNESLQFIQTHKGRCDYARVSFEIMNSIHYYLEGRIENALRVLKKILVLSKPTQASLQIATNFNIGEAYYRLENDREAASYYAKAVSISQSTPQLAKKNYPELYYNYYTTLTSLGEYKTANIFADSAHIHLRRALNEKNEKNRLELETRYQTTEKQKQIAELRLQQEQTENRNRFVLTLLGIAVVVALALGYLGLRLRQANTQLRQLTQVRDQLFGIVAHDLRRPLFAFQNLSQLIHFYLRKKDYAAIEEVSANINESGVKLQQMLDNLVAWAMSQGEVLPYQPTDVVVGQEVNEIVELYKAVYVLKKVNFEVAIPPDLVAYADLNGFRVIVRNLIDNSTKALPDSGYLRITGRVLDSAQAELTFTDNAGGLSPSLLTAIERVFAAPHKAQIGADGLGMGLVMVARFVQRNGGRISVESHEGKGTTFRVRLKPAPKSAL